MFRKVLSATLAVLVAVGVLLTITSSSNIAFQKGWITEFTKAIPSRDTHIEGPLDYCESPCITITPMLSFSFPTFPTTPEPWSPPSFATSTCYSYSDPQGKRFPLITVKIGKAGTSGGWVTVGGVLVDTGASATMLPRKYVDALGIDLRAGRRCYFWGVSEQKMGCYIHKVQIAVMVTQEPTVFPSLVPSPSSLAPFEAQVIFPESYDVKDRVLGRMDILDNLTLSFDSKKVCLSTP